MYIGLLSISTPCPTPQYIETMSDIMFATIGHNMFRGLQLSLNLTFIKTKKNKKQVRLFTK